MDHDGDGRQATMAAEDRAGEAVARASADRLALALEEAGFDVGQDFPALFDAIGHRGNAVVRVGDIRPAVADRLSALLTRVPEEPYREFEEGNNR